MPAASAVARAASLALLVALAGCSSGGALAVFGDEGLVSEDSTAQGSLACGTTGVLATRVSSPGGSIVASVRDGAGATIADRVTFAGAHDGEMDLAGASGTWTLDVRLRGFTGDYRIEMRC